jgi:peptide/nickel transport system permease protein
VACPVSISLAAESDGAPSGSKRKQPVVGPIAGSRDTNSIWRRFRCHRLAVIGSTLLLLLIVSSVAAPLIARQDAYHVDLRAYRKPPSAEHRLGTDSSGRDVMARVLLAGRISLSVGLVAVSIYLTIGVVLGGLSGFYGGWIDSSIMRLADMVLAFPSLIIIITVVSLIGPSVYNVMLVIGCLGWPPIARLVRCNVLSIRERDYVVAARASGAKNDWILARHVLPNVVAPVIVAASFGMAQAIILEAGLSFLGLGVQPPTPSWGNMLTDAQSFRVLEEMTWLWLPPGAMIALAVLAINFVGDGLRDALDPQMRR